MKNFISRQAVSITMMLGMALFAAAQASPDASAAPHANLTANYPRNQVGVLVQSTNWVPIAAAMPGKSRAKHGLAASLSYGAVPATLVAEYDGLHAQVQIEPGQPVICICHFVSLPGDPVLVRFTPRSRHVNWMAAGCSCYHWWVPARPWLRRRAT